MPRCVVLHTNIIFFFSFFRNWLHYRGNDLIILKYFSHRLFCENTGKYWIFDIEFTDLDSSEFAARQLVGLLRLKYHLVNTNFTEDISRELFWPPSKTVARQMLIGLINWLQQSETYILINHKPKSCLFTLFYSIPGSSGPDRGKYEINMMVIWR